MEFTKIGIIDRIPKKEFDRDKLVKWVLDQKTYMENDRQVWMARQRKYLDQWDDYITYPRKGLWEESSNVHLPLTMQMCKALHARCKQALFAVNPPYVISPIEKLDIQRIKTIDIVMKWALANYINYYKGIELVIDDWIWDFVTIGWAVMKRRWDIVERKAIVLEEVAQNVPVAEAVDEISAILEGGEQEKAEEVIAKEVEKIIPYFDGPVIQTVPHEDIWFPGRCNDTSDLDEHVAVFHQFKLTESEIRIRQKIGLFEEESAEKVLTKGLREPGTTADTTDRIEKKKREDKLQGVQTVDSQVGPKESDFLEGYIRYDLDDDGIDEKLVVVINPDTRELVRWTYLDRITKTGKNPLHKIDLLRRPRRSYSLGMIELLYSINNEIDAMHNMQMDVGTISNVPFFFYRATCGLKPEKIKIEPGVGYPLDDPQNDINIPRWGNMTYWSATQEQSLTQWAERLTSLTAMNMGMPTPTVGASRTAAGMMALLNEGNLNIDIQLSRLKIGYSELLKGILADLQERLPDSTMVRVLGSMGETLFGPQGQPWIEKVNRTDIAGRVDFILSANSQNSNRELEKTNAIMYSQMLLNPINIQTGIVSPRNIYSIMRNVLEKHGVLNFDDFVTPPQMAPSPLSLYDEIAAVTQGLIPAIQMNDNHQAKVQGLTMFSQEPSFVEGIARGVNSPRAMEALNIAVNIHANMAAAIQAQAQPSNVTGLQTSPTLGAKIAGQQLGGQNVGVPGTEGPPALAAPPAGQGTAPSGPA